MQYDTTPASGPSGDYASNMPYCYPTVAELWPNCGRRLQADEASNTAVRSLPRTSGDPGNQFSLAQVSGRPRACAFSISARVDDVMRETTVKRGLRETVAYRNVT